MPPATSITTLAETYLRARDVSSGYRDNMMRAARRMEAAGITPQNISGSAVSEWLSACCNSGLSGVTVGSMRQCCLTLWRYGIEEGVISSPVRGVMRPRIARPVTRAFGRGDLTDAVKRLATSEFHAFRSGCPKSLWLETWVRFVYETGARFGDAYNLRSSHIVPGGVAWTVRKTGQPLVRRVSEKTMAGIKELLARSPDGTVFRWAASRSRVYEAIREAFPAVGLEGGRTQWLRRSGATHAEIAAPGTGAAKAYLGHATHGLAEKHYIDHVQLLPSTPAPPSLD